jgi:hypothetical protein
VAGSSWQDPRGRLLVAESSWQNPRGRILVAGSWFAPPRLFTKLIRYALRETLSVFTTRLSNNQMIIIYIFLEGESATCAGVEFPSVLPRLLSLGSARDGARLRGP